MAERRHEIMLLYSGGVVLIFGTFLLLYQHAWRKRRELALSPADEVTLRFGRRSHLISALLGVVSMSIAALIRADWVGAPAGLIYFLMGPLHTWNGMMEGKAQRALHAPVPSRHA
jgi:Na+/proline symporter